MNSFKIQYKLKLSGHNQKAIADELDVSQMAVSKVIRKQMVSDRIMRAIAAKIGVPPEAVFPEYYAGPPQRSTSKVA